MFKRNALKQLQKWKSDPRKKPLVLRGARQVGKTKLVDLLASSEYDNYFNINLDRLNHLEIYQHINTVEEFRKVTEIVFGKPIKEGSLVFIDEIQNATNLIKLLRFFYEDNCNFDVIAAGSLLETKLKEESISIPVGRVEYKYIYPLTFYEYLRAMGEDSLADELSTIDLNDVSTTDGVEMSIDALARRHFEKYVVYGGMPEIVNALANNASEDEIRSIFNSLLQAYQDDVYKYTSAPKAAWVSHVIKNAPLVAGGRFNYSEVGAQTFNSSQISDAISTVESIRIVHTLQATNSSMIPIAPNPKQQKKLIYLDVGLVNHRLGNQYEVFGNKVLDHHFRGRIAEQIVGQTFIAMNNNLQPDLYYWARKKEEGSAEVDFVYAENGFIVATEVKSGKKGKLQSLFSYSNDLTKKGQRHTLIRIHNGALRNEKLEFADKNYQVLSIPAYLQENLAHLNK